MFLLLCRSWEEERSSLTSQIEALRREARLYTSSSKGKAARGSSGADAGAGAAGAGGDAASVDEDDASPEVQLAVLRRALDEAKENEVSTWFGFTACTCTLHVGFAWELMHLFSCAWLGKLSCCCKLVVAEQQQQQLFGGMQACCASADR
jgi:hypothetical protein